MQNRGVLVAIEKTGDGVGGSTQAQLLYEKLNALGLRTRLTREPGGTELGKQLRKILLDPAVDLANATELFLLMADRAQHYHEVLKPYLDAGYIVITDRYYDSTRAYQGGGRGWEEPLLETLHQVATNLLLPDLVVVLHGKPHRSRSKDDRFERLDDAFHERVRNKMLEIAASSSRYITLTANIPQEELAMQIFEVFQDRFPQFFR